MSRTDPNYYRVLPWSIQSCVVIDKKEYTKSFPFCKHDAEEAKKLAKEYSLSLIKSIKDNIPPVRNRSSICKNKKTTGIRGVYRSIYQENRENRSHDWYLRYSVSMYIDKIISNKTFQVGNINTITPFDDLHGYIMASKFRAVYLLSRECETEVNTSFYLNWNKKRLFEKSIEDLYFLSTM